MNGELHKRTLSIHHRAGLALYEAGWHRLGLAIVRNMATAVEGKYGESATLAGYLGDLGSLLADQGRRAEAGRMHRRAVEIRRFAPGVEPHQLATSLRNLGSAVWALGRTEEAREVFEEALSLQLGAGPRSVAETPGVTAAAREPRSSLGAARIMLKLAELEYRVGRLEEAERYSGQAVAALEPEFGDAHPRTPEARVLHGKVLQRLARHTEAADEFRRSLEYYAPRKPRDDADLARLRLRYAASLAREDRTAEAREALTLALSRGGLARAGPGTELAKRVEGLLAALRSPEGSREAVALALPADLAAGLNE